ncbi:MAG TPA: branched-chain amino acid transaminase [Thermomicrobiales bacterium]|nr:branched-chain amino acid transaminase [Thermomicrobiales bacterium]
MELPLQPFAYFEGEFVPSDQAKVSIATHALQYGTGAFGGIRGYLDVSEETINIFRLPDHTRRLMNSGRILRARLELDASGLAAVIQELVARNNPKSNVYIRPFIYKAGLDLTPSLRDVRDSLAIYMIAFGDYFAMDKPLRVMVSSWVRLNDNIIPSRGKITGGYINSSLAKDQADEAGYDDALMLNTAGKVAEGSGANLFLVRNGTLITSPINSDILEGITRRSILMFARDAGIPAEEREIDRSELYVADEAFFCGTGAQVASIGSVDGRAVGDGTRGPITERIQDIFFSLVRGQDRTYDELLTKVPVRP